MLSNFDCSIQLVFFGRVMKIACDLHSSISVNHVHFNQFLFFEIKFENIFWKVRKLCAIPSVVKFFSSFFLVLFCANTERATERKKKASNKLRSNIHNFDRINKHLKYFLRIYYTTFVVYDAVHDKFAVCTVVLSCVEHTKMQLWFI